MLENLLAAARGVPLHRVRSRLLEDVATYCDRFCFLFNDCCDDVITPQCSGELANSSLYV